MTWLMTWLMLVRDLFITVSDDDFWWLMALVLGLGIFVPKTLDDIATSFYHHILRS